MLNTENKSRNCIICQKPLINTYWYHNGTDNSPCARKFANVYDNTPNHISKKQKFDWTIRTILKQKS